MLNILKAVGFSYARTNLQITVMKKIITKLCSIALNSNVSNVTMCSLWSAHQDLKAIHWVPGIKRFIIDQHGYKAICTTY